MRPNPAIRLLIDELARSKSVRHVNYVGFGLRLSDCLDLARQLRDEPYQYDEAGTLDYECDLKTLTDKLSALYAEFLTNKHDWSE